MKKITQEMRYRQSLVNYAVKHGVVRAARKYNRCRSYIYFWLKRYDGSIESLAERSRRPHGHPNEHTESEIKLIRDMRRRNPRLGMNELWYRLKERGYTRRPESLYRVMCRLGMFEQAVRKKKYQSKPYEQMTRPGERVQIDVKVVPSRCRVGDCPKLYQYTAIDEYSRLRFLAAYDEQSTFSSASFLRDAVRFYRRHGITVECVQTDNGFEFTNRFTNSNRKLITLFEKTAHDMGIAHKLIRPYTPRHNGKVERSHREDIKRFYDLRTFYSLADLGGQLAAHLRYSNRLPMRPLRWLSPLSFLRLYSVQLV